MRLLPCVAAALACAALPASAASEFQSVHPEEAYPDNAPMLNSPGPYADYFRQVQTRLHEEGFDAGPVNGDFGSKTQAALAQFQLSRALPVSGTLDEETLKQLGVVPPLTLESPPAAVDTPQGPAEQGG